jgi:hypothetical protein
VGGTISPMDPKRTNRPTLIWPVRRPAEEMRVNLYGAAKDHCPVHRLRTPNCRRIRECRGELPLNKHRGGDQEHKKDGQ